MAIGTLAAIGIAAAAGGAAAYSSHEQSKAAKEAAESQQDWMTQQYAPSKELEQLQLQQYKDITMPYTEDIYGLWKDYGKDIATEQLKAYQEVGQPLYRTMGAKVSADVENPWADTEDIYNKIWQRTREKTAAEWAPIEQRTSQRLAGAGALESGASLKMFGDIEQAKYKSNETLAIEQAIQEFNLQTQAKQQAYENAFRYMGYTPSTSTPSVSTSAVGTIQPYTSIPSVSSGLGEGLSTALQLYSLMGSGGSSGTSSNAIQGGVGGQTMYTPQYGTVWSPYTYGGS